MKKRTLKLLTSMLIVIIGIFLWNSFINQKQRSTEIIQEKKEDNLLTNFSVSTKKYPVIYTVEQSSDILVVVNKKHALPKEYEPEVVQSNGVRLRSGALEKYVSMIKEASADGINLAPISSYRSYTDQEKLFNEYVQQDGQENAETYSARPGHSEHQLGLAVDIGLPSGSCNLMTCMAETKEGIWLSQNAHRFGYIIRYPKDKEDITGYQYEPWHIRYVGVDVAKKIYESNYTLDEYFGISAGNYTL